MAERPRRRVSGPPRSLAAHFRRIRRGRRRQCDRPGAGRGRRADRSRAPRDPGQLLHDGGVVERRPDVRRHGARPDRLRLRAHPGLAAVARRPLLLACIRLRLGRRGRRRSPAGRHPLRGGGRGRDVAPAPLLEPPPRQGRPGVRGLRPADPLRPHGGRLAARRLGAALHDGLVLPRGLRDPAERRARRSRPGDDEPRHARPRHPGRDRHRAGAPRLRLPGRRRRALDAPRLQRRHEADDHRHQRRRSASSRSS